MNSNFDEYIKKNRNLLDVDEPNDDLIWLGINNKQTKKKSFFSLWKIAATILILLAGAFYLSRIIQADKQAVSMTLASISPELANQEMSFFLVIDKQLEEIEKSKINKETYAPFFDELKILDELNAEYLEDLNTEPVNPRLISALLRYYEQKIRILEQLLMEIEKTKNHENKITEA